MGPYQPEPHENPPSRKPPRTKATRYAAALLVALALAGTAAACLAIRGRSQELVRPGFRLQHPRNWKIDTADRNYDPDRHFSVDSPGTGFVMFMFLSDPAEPAEALAAEVEELSRFQRNIVRTPFEKYGRYAGKGLELHGQIELGITLTVRVFCFRQGGRTAIVVQQCPDDEMPASQAGFETIEKSFEVMAP